MPDLFAAQRSVNSNVPQPAPLRVLLVEDNLDAATALLLTLQNWGYDSRACTSGDEALALAPSFRPNVVLLDIGLPGMDGWQLARKLRQLGVNATFIAVTAHGEGDDYYRSRKAGIDFHLVKPDFNP
jgi:CheY-like chemotaxis protein